MALIPELDAQLSSRQPSCCRHEDRKSTRLNSSHSQISYAVFCLEKNTAHPQRSPCAGSRPPVGLTTFTPVIPTYHHCPRPTNLPPWFRATISPDTLPPPSHPFPP